uniref:RES family NAD+ phosphorylase n=1 Tax=Litoreibacter albidus TaxID=670155 RepID=UPI0037365571
MPTQVVSEYLRHLHNFKQGNNERTVDAIIYRSAQNGTEKNIAIFGDAGSAKDGATSSDCLWQREKPSLLVVSTFVEKPLDKRGGAPKVRCLSRH